MKWKLNILIFIGISLLSYSCKRPKTVLPSIQDSENMQADDAIPMNEAAAYPYPNSNEGYELAGKELANPLQQSTDNLEKGKVLYSGLCKHCHGEIGDAKAPMIEKEKYPPPPPFSKRLPTISDGKKFHSITYGKNQMPPNKDDLNAEQKWLLVMYIKTLIKQDEVKK